MKTAVVFLIAIISSFVAGGFLAGIMRKVIKYLTPQKFVLTGEFVRSWVEPTTVPLSMATNDNYYLGNPMQSITININYLSLRDDSGNETTLQISQYLLNKINCQLLKENEVIVSCRKYKWEELPEVINVI